PPALTGATGEVMSYKNLVAIAEASAERFADRPLFGERHDGGWRWLTYRQFQHEVDTLRAGLAQLGVGRGDRVAIVSRNSTAWAVASYATLGLGATFVPMYESQRLEDWEFILRDCGARVVFVRTPKISAALDSARSRLPGLQDIITIEDGEDSHSMTTVQALGAEHPVASIDAEPDDVAGLIYTSGTTGLPKGVMLTHRNYVSNLEATYDAVKLYPDDRSVSFLPWAHIYGQLCELHYLISVGGSTAFNTQIDKLLDDLHEVRPTVLVAVPRIFNKIHARVRAQIEERPRVIRTVFSRGMAAAIRHYRGEKLSMVETVWWLLGRVLFAAVRRKFGGRLRFAVTGSATMTPEVAEFINGLGIHVYEGYGLSETTAPVAISSEGNRRFGSVGRPIKGVRLELDHTATGSPDEGEIIVYGPCVMKGYHARPEENARAFTADGGLRTGDVGRFDRDGFLYITGRLKEQFKLENGKYVMPGPLEEKLALSPFVQNVFIYGAGRPYTVALAVLDEARVRSWASERGIVLPADPTGDSRVRALIQSELDAQAQEFASYERPRDVLLTLTPFTTDNGMLTPTLKLKRRQVESAFGAALAALYTPAMPARSASLPPPERGPTPAPSHR
ncbi:MAG TPA: long-chain fatty acid--CoA ligase, partial [Kofleriaceae bacterium]